MRRRGTGCVIAVTTVLLFIFVAVLVVRMIWKSLYPYGARPCCLPCMNMALLFYAEENGGWFPAGGANPWESLRKVETDPVLLAGVTGDRAALLERVKNGEMLDHSVSSWVYFPGFRQDELGELAIIWERAPGIGLNGHTVKKGGHAVGFADGHSEFIYGAEWSAFLAEQKRIREALQAYHSEHPDGEPMTADVQKMIRKELYNKAE